jgi:hypothetical protein
VFGSITRSLGSIFSTGFFYDEDRNKCEEVVDRVTSLVENIAQNARVHNFSELMRANKFVAIDDSTLIHKNLSTQLQEKFRNNIDFNFLVQNSIPISKTLDAMQGELDEKKIRNKMKLVLSKLNPTTQSGLRKMQINEDIIVSNAIISNSHKDRRKERN